MFVLSVSTTAVRVYRPCDRKTLFEALHLSSQRHVVETGVGICTGASGSVHHASWVDRASQG